MAPLTLRPSHAHNLVVKIGSSLLVDPDGGLRTGWLAGLARDVAWLHGTGCRLILVSSGSIALGRNVLGLGQGLVALEQSQAAAAVGQIRLARAYEQALAEHDITAAQVLVTLDDIADRRRYLNSRATLAQLQSLGVVPIVNENDTIATDEIRYGDNDRLAAQIAVATGADQLVLLSDVDGFYSANPRTDTQARRFETLREITPEIEAMAGDAASTLSRGGMKTKLLAAKTAMGAGCAMAICYGGTNRPLLALENGAAVSWFLPREDPKSARKRWISAMKPKGSLSIDEGAARALIAGKSLLPAGVNTVSGAFQRGDPVRILAPGGALIGVGLVRYTALEAVQILGHRSKDIEPILGYPGRAALVHRDDMVL